ncbi:MAG: hypothetical protein JXR81_08475 [Candidatus Goldbacteria bacterium]|nr:hypothetical protein [Candidatus Goldiibacteriota bacterium]
MAIAANLIFAGSFLFYFMFSGPLYIMPGIYYAAPVVVFTYLILFSGVSAYITGKTFKKSFLSCSPVLFVFILLFLSPLAVKFNFPEPHNFMQRKLELVLGISYALFIISAAGLLFMEILKNEKGYKNPAVLCAAFFIVFSGVSVWMNHANQPTGDEPVYLLTAHSLIHDFDLDLKNNFENKDYSGFYKGELKPQERDIKEKIVSFHPVMISVLITPFYLTAGRMGVTLFINLMAALFCCLLYLILVKGGHNEKNSFITAFLTGMSMPFILFTNQIATETASAFFLAAAYYFIRYQKNRIFIPALSAIFFMWLHPRNMVVWGVLCVIALIEYRVEIKKALVFAASQGAGLIVFLFYNYAVFGHIMPPAMEKPVSSVSEVFSLNIAGMAGILFDQEFGLFFFTPVFSLMFAGAVLMFKRDKKTFYYIMAMFIPLFILVTAWIDWRGGGGSGPRFLVPVILMVSLLTAEVLNACDNAEKKKVFYILAGIGLVISAVIFLVPWFRWNKGLGENWIFKFLPSAGNFEVSSLFPSIWAKSAGWQIKTVLWAGAAVLLNVFFLKDNKLKR